MANNAGDVGDYSYSARRWRLWARPHTGVLIPLPLQLLVFPGNLYN